MCSLVDPMRIALVEPSRTVRRIIVDLVQQWGYEVAAFPDGPEALNHVERDDAVHVLITSAVLPTMSGADLCATARKRIKRPLYIIVISSSHEYTKCVQALDHGADEFITKPPIMEELRARLRTADRVTKMQCELVQLARTDSLTKLPNRAAFFADASEAIERAQKTLPLSAIMLDLESVSKVMRRERCGGREA
jgi:two-component system cell cycle response regulator